MVVNLAADWLDLAVDPGVEFYQNQEQELQADEPEVGVIEAVVSDTSGGSGTATLNDDEPVTVQWSERAIEREMENLKFANHAAGDVLKNNNVGYREKDDKSSEANAMTRAMLNDLMLDTLQQREFMNRPISMNIGGQDVEFTRKEMDDLLVRYAAQLQAERDEAKRRGASQEELDEYDQRLGRVNDTIEAGRDPNVSDDEYTQRIGDLVSDDPRLQSMIQQEFAVEPQLQISMDEVEQADISALTEDEATGYLAMAAEVFPDQAGQIITLQGLIESGEISMAEAASTIEKINDISSDMSLSDEEAAIQIELALQDNEVLSAQLAQQMEVAQEIELASDPQEIIPEPEVVEEVEIAQNQQNGDQPDGFEDGRDYANNSLGGLGL